MELELKIQENTGSNQNLKKEESNDNDNKENKKESGNDSFDDEFEAFEQEFNEVEEITIEDNQNLKDKIKDK